MKHYFIGAMKSFLLKISGTKEALNPNFLNLTKNGDKFWL